MKDENYKQKNLGPIYAYPMGIWFTIFFIAPILIILAYSFLKKGLYGGVEMEFSLKAFRQMLNPTYGMILLRTLWIAVISSALTLLIAFPCGYAMARSNHQTLLLFLVIITFWTNSLIRIFAWMSILGNDGSLNRLLMFLHITDDYIQFLYNQNAIILVSVYMYIPYAILPLFTAIDRFDFSLLEAARDLGATKFQSVRMILIPSVRGGLVSAMIFTFIPIFGAYSVPLLVGGTDSAMIGNIIVDQVTKTRNWPLACSFSLMLTVLSLFGVIWMIHTGRRDEKLIKK
ncbi:MAG: ABC transporter permease [Treponema sp.]|nr:ABC transporter permease [Treponema sp.]MBR6913455.1 ABC transporter permease [Treponema sp.]